MSYENKPFTDQKQDIERVEVEIIIAPKMEIKDTQKLSSQVFSS